MSTIWIKGMVSEDQGDLCIEAPGGAVIAPWAKAKIVELLMALYPSYATVNDDNGYDLAVYSPLSDRPQIVAEGIPREHWELAATLINALALTPGALVPFRETSPQGFARGEHGIREHWASAWWRS